MMLNFSSIYLFALRAALLAKRLWRLNALPALGLLFASGMLRSSLRLFFANFANQSCKPSHFVSPLIF
jgi:hypothetical protein